LTSDEEADSLLEELVRDPVDDGSTCTRRQPASLDETDEIWSRIGREQTDEPAQADVESVYDNARLKDLLVALRRRLNGIPIGSCTSERVALALDLSRIDAIEREAIVATSPGEEESILAHTALVGLLMRDLGAVRSDLEDLGVDEATLSSAWLLELDRDFGRLVSRELADPSQYARVSKLSGIKTKHLLAPLASRRERRPSLPADEPETESRSERRTGTPPRQGGQVAERAADPDRMQVGRAWRAILASQQTRTWAGAAVMMLAVFLTANVVTQRPTTVETLDAQTLSRTSPFLQSAYRNDQGRGRTLIGRLDADFEKLSHVRQLAVAREMVDLLWTDGVDEVMLYGPKGHLLVHSTDGELRRPSPRTE
jgi:hypothetical protein